MAEETATLEQIAWANEYLRILGEELDSGDDDEGDSPGQVNRYGKGYTAFDSRPLPKALEEALKSETGAMPSAKDWNEMSMGPGKTEEQEFDKHRNTIKNHLADFVKWSEEWSKHNTKVKELEGPPEQSGLLQARLSRMDAKQQVDNIKNMAREDMTKCLPMIDAPENNPERKKVGQLLADLEELDKMGYEPQIHSREKCRKLYEMQKELFAWNDRRARNNLPPSAEAVAMGELLQKAHQTMTADILKNEWPIVVADEDRLSDEEKRHVQEAWDNLRDDTGRARNNEETKGKLVVAPKEAPPVTTAEQLEQFRVETMSNFLRLMGSEAGRRLIDSINEKGHKVTIAPTTENEGASCTGTLGDIERFMTPAGEKRKGGGSQVNMVFGAKDSDVALNTSTGVPIFSPRFITLGHELIHALHNSRGANRQAMDMPQGLDQKTWSDTEEVWTILKGKTSEKVLRDQLGLSAVRFGHNPIESGQEVTSAYLREIEALDYLKKNGEKDINEALVKLGWKDPGALGNVLKKELFKDDVKGPLPDGWDANQLTVAQIQIIRTKKLAARLPALGWTPYDLTDVVRLEQVLTTEEHHPSSKLGRRFRSLGGDEALKAISAFNNETKNALAVGDDAHWPSKLRALADADRWLRAFGKAVGGVTQTITDAKGGLKAKLEKVAKDWKTNGDAQKSQAVTAFLARGGYEAIEAVGRLNTAAKTVLPVGTEGDLTSMSAALGKVATWLTALADAIDKGEGEILSAVITSSVRGGGRLEDTLLDVIDMYTRGAAKDTNYLGTEIAAANKVLTG